MVISGLGPGARDSNGNRYLRNNLADRTSSTGCFSSTTYNGLYGIRGAGRRLVHGMSFPMTDSVIKTAFENVAGHLSNLEIMRELVEEIEKDTDSIENAIKVLEEKCENTEITLRTDMRILINECRHLQSRMASE